MSAAAGAAAAVAAMNAMNASGGMVRVAPGDFVAVVERTESPLVVYCYHKNWLTGKEMFQYITSYKGLSFVTMAFSELNLPKGVELLKAKSMYLPV
jgi:hypothetical protein